MRLVKETFHYIPILKTLEALLSHPDILSEVWECFRSCFQLFLELYLILGLGDGAGGGVGNSGSFGWGCATGRLEPLAYLD